MDALKEHIAGSSGPTFSGTKAEANKFHDDKSLYTGVYAQGGPTNVDVIGNTASFGQSPNGLASKTQATQDNDEEEKAPKTKSKIAATSSHPASNLQEVFERFTGGAAEMDGKVFAKMAKDTKILDKNLTATDIDLIFAKIKDKSARKISYAQFEAGIGLCATKKKVTVDKLTEAICAVGGPVFTGTKAEAVKYHDDKSLYTGVYANGGPTTVDAGKGVISDIS